MSPGAAVSLAYYACFYAASAILVYEGRQFAKHSGVRSALHQHLIKTNRLPNEIGCKYDVLSGARQKADYQVMDQYSAEEAIEMVKAAEDIVASPNRLLPADMRQS